MVLDRVVWCSYLEILRATRPQATSRAPTPSVSSGVAPLPPVFGSSFFSSFLASSFFSSTFAAGAGAGAGAAFGAGAGAGADTGAGAVADTGAGAGAGAGAGTGAGTVCGTCSIPPSRLMSNSCPISPASLLWSDVWSTCAIAAGATTASANASTSANSIIFLKILPPRESVSSVRLAFFHRRLHTSTPDARFLSIFLKAS